MKFEIKRGSCKNIDIFYRENENSFDCEPLVNTDIMIMIQYMTLGFDSMDMSAKQIYGYHPKGGWIEKILKQPESFWGDLILINDIEPGLAQRLPQAKSWHTYYDKNIGWVCMGDCDLAYDYVAVEFIKNCIAVLYNGKLASLWLKPTFKLNV